MAELEFGGMTFRGGKIFAILTALSTLGGGAWAGFEFYADYMDMKEIVQNIDIDEIAAANELQVQKLDDAIQYTQDIKNDLRADIIRIEGLVSGLEDRINESESTIRAFRNEIYDKLDAFEARFRSVLKDNQDAMAASEERLRIELKSNQDTMAAMRDTIATRLEESESRIKATQGSIETTLEGVRNEMNQVQKDVTASIREVEGTIRVSEKDVRNTMRETESRIDKEMGTLERDLKEIIQESLDNPLAN